MADTVVCPDCGQRVDVPTGLTPGERFECPYCAGTFLRWEGGERVTRVYTVSCPHCDRVLDVPDNAVPGDHLRSCGRTWKLTWAYGAWALEPDSADPVQE